VAEVPFRNNLAVELHVPSFEPARDFCGVFGFEELSYDSTIPAGLAIWQHELATAEALAKVGYVVEFLPVDKRKDTKSPDVVMNGEKWEIKAPKTDKLSAIERNLKRATKQSDNIIIDSRRMSKLHAGY
jgi:hypothetical protein